MATLILTMISANNLGLTNTFKFTETGGTLGRAPDCDWVLDDGERFISNKHLLVSFANGKFVVTDTSSNGTFLNKSSTPVGKGNAFEPKVNDTLTLGTIELVVTELQLSAEQSNGLLDLMSPAEAEQYHHQAKAVDPLTPQASSTSSQSNLGLFDILSQQNMPVAAPPENTNPITSGVVQPPAQTNAASQSVNTENKPPDNYLNTIPDDWELDDESHSCEPVEVAVTSPSVPVNNPAPAPQSPSKHVETSPAQELQSAPIPDTPTPQNDAFFDALYTRLGLPQNTQNTVDKSTFIEDIATVLTISTQGLMGLLAGRSAFKQESRLSMTMIQPRSNNPIKFSLDPSDALEMLLVKKKPGYLSAKVAYEEAINDVLQHQMAFLTGLQASLEGLLEELSPEALEQEAKQKGRSFISKSSSAQKWALYREKHAKTLSSVKENLNDVLATHFSAAYEAHINNAKKN